MKIKEVKATITVTKVNCTVFNEEVGIAESTVSLPATFKTENGLEKAVREYLRHDNLSLVKINDVVKIHGIYSMPIDKFMAGATYTEE